jgi:hypothetical protein
VAFLGCRRRDDGRGAGRPIVTTFDGSHMTAADSFILASDSLLYDAASRAVRMFRHFDGILKFDFIFPISSERTR